MAAHYLVRHSHDDRAAARPAPGADSALEAAIVFAEHWDGSGEVSVTVTDCETGHEQCFRVDFDDRVAEPC